MNFQCDPLLHPLKVLVINPLSPASQLLVSKILSGKVFDSNQLIDLTLLVYSNEVPAAEGFKYELSKCAFQCVNSIAVTSDLPSISDADVFCFISNLIHPNIFNLEEGVTEEQFDAIYLIIKIANNLSVSLSQNTLKHEIEKPKKKIRKPIFMCDGLVVMDILKSIAENVPPDVFFCSTPLSNITKLVLGDYLKLKFSEINEVLVWAANDEIFHVEVEKPIVVNDKLENESHCEGDDILSKEHLQSIKLDSTQFSASWMKKELIEKVKASATSNPYGCIYSASQFATTLKNIWTSRINNEIKVYTNVGVISDGSLETVKGLPYVLPVIFNGDSWSINTKYIEGSHLKQEIKRINKAVKARHDELIPYCKKFLEDNVINQAFIPVEDSSTFLTRCSSTTSY